MEHKDVDREIAQLKGIRFTAHLWGDGTITLDTFDGVKMKTLPFWSDGDVYDLFWELPETDRQWIRTNAQKQYGTFDNGTPLMGYDHKAIIERWLMWRKGLLATAPGDEQ